MNFIEELTGLIAVAGFFATVVLSLYFYFRVRNKERMAMIEKGQILPAKKSNPGRALKTGVFLMGIALGIFFGHIVGRYTTIHEVVAYFVLILLFGGIALSLNYIIELKLKKREE